MDGKKKFKVVTLGCRTNQYESEAYADQLRALGYAEAMGEEIAEVCIVNTCTVTEGADRSSRHEIRKLARENPGSKLLVTGCLAERVPDEIVTLGGVSHVVSNREKETLLERIFPQENLPEFQIEQFGAHTRAFVKVQDGCNSYCTYCVIPYVRGRSRSRPLKEVVEEVERLVAGGYKEVVITGINVGDYEGGLAELIRAVDRVEGLKRLRLSSIDPDEVGEELSRAILEGKNTCPSMHIVLQSGSNVILKRMNRKYTRQIFMDTVNKLKMARPEFTFTTDLIVGFPGETEADFEESLQVMREVGFVKVHMFPYSKRPRTRAALYPDQVSHSVIAERKQRVLREAEQIAFAQRESYVGKSVEVLVEGDGAGHTETFIPVRILEGEFKQNEIVRVRCTQNRPEGLIGVIDVD